MRVNGIRNAPSLKPSSPFGQIYQTTSDNKKTSEFKNNFTLTNAYAAGLQDLGSKNIIQGSNEYSEVNVYQITFKPYSVSKANKMNIQLSYPATVSPSPKSTECYVEAGNYRSPQGKCSKIEGARLFKIVDAIPANHSDMVKIFIELENPPDNWGRVGVKIKTYEQGPNGTEFLADILEGNELIPILKCIAPCKECKDKGAVIDKNYCTECWLSFP